MLPLYEKIEDLCKKRGINITQMCREAGVARAVLSDYKWGRKKTIGIQNLTKLATYFGVSVDYLIGHEESQNKETPVLTEKDRRDIAKDLEKIKQEMENGGDLMFDGVPMTQEAIDSMLSAMQVGMEMVRLKNKEKYGTRKRKKE